MRSTNNDFEENYIEEVFLLCTRALTHQKHHLCKCSGIHMLGKGQMEQI